MPVGQRPLGRTGQQISEIGFGCGNQAGLLVRGEFQDQVRAAARAIELGISYFDTAAQYGDGKSEENLGRVLHELKPDVLVGTKLQFGQPEVAEGPGRLQALLDQSLRRLARDSVDILFYHGRIGQPGPRSLSVGDMMGPVLDTFQGFRQAGKTRFIGFTGLGDTLATMQAIQPGAFDVFHCYYSAVNPSAGYALPDTLGQQNLRGLMDRAREVGMGVFAIRILAAGALAGKVPKHPLASRGGGALIQGVDYGIDQARAERLRPIAEELGIGLPELGMRFALSKPEVSCALVGFSDLDQVEEAAKASEAGPLPDEVVRRIVELAAG